MIWTTVKSLLTVLQGDMLKILILGLNGGEESWVLDWVLDTWPLSGQDVLGLEVLPRIVLPGLLWHVLVRRFLGVDYWTLGLVDFS